MTYIPHIPQKDVFFIDGSVADKDVLIAGLPAGAEVVVLQTATDGLAQIADYLDGRSGIDALHILSHGSDGALYLGNSAVDTNTLSASADLLDRIGASLSETGDILLYGCDVAATATGEAFVVALAEATGANVAASRTPTGSADLGGDWELPVHVGAVTATVGFSAAARENFSSVLATSDEAFDDKGFLNVTATSTTIGDWTFTNASSTSLQNVTYAESALNLNNDGGAGDRTFAWNKAGNPVTDFSFQSADGSEFKLVSFDYGVGSGGNSSVTITGLRDGVIVVSAEAVDLTTSDSSGNITYSHTATTGGGPYGTLTFNSAFDNIDQINFSFGGASDPEIDNIDVSAAVLPNNPPALGGTPADDTATEDVATAIDLSAYTVSDGDGDPITLTLAVDRGTIASTDGNGGPFSGVTVAGSGTASMTLSGSVANLNTYLDIVTKIEYTTALNDTTAATLTVTPNDGTEDGTADTVAITITPVNDAPTETGLPTDVTVTEDTASNVDLSATTFTDVDGDNLTVTLTASAGTFSTPANGAAVGAGVTETLLNSTTITLVGSAADISTYLDTASNIRYTGAGNVNGNNAATLSITANDGNGSGDVALGTVNVDISAVNDAPTVSGAPSDITVTEETASDVDLSGVTFADVDSNSLTITLTASSGTFAASSGGGVSVGGSGTGALSIYGAVADINTFLDTASNIQYTGATDVSGNDAATITISASDGSGGSLAANPVINLDITNINDAPTLTATGATPTYVEGAVATDLYSIVNAAVNDSGQYFTGLTLTVTNVSDGASEILTIDGSDVALTNGNSVTTATSSQSVNVSVSGSTATVSFTGATLNAGLLQNLVDGLSYRNTSDDPTTGTNRVVTITGITDSGSDTNSAAPNLVATVSLTAVNDAPVISNLAGDNSGLQPGNTANIDNGTNATVTNADSADYNGGSLIITDNGANNTANGNFSVDGTAVTSGGDATIAAGETISVGGTAIGTVHATNDGQGGNTWRSISIPPTPPALTSRR